MREIDNKLNSVNFKGIQKPSVEEVTTPEVAPASNAETKEIKDLANMPAAALGNPK